MKNVISAVFVAVSCVLAVSGQVQGGSKIEGVRDPSSGWRRISSKADGFSVLMPSAATVSSEKGPAGAADSSLRFYEAKSDDSITLVGVVDMTAEFNDPAVPKTPEFREVMLAAMFEGAESGMRSTLPKEMSLENVGLTSIGTANGKLYKISLGDMEIGRLKIVVKGYRAYMFMAASVQGEDSSPVNMFFDSVQLH